jgi:hypothetical protein
MHFIICSACGKSDCDGFCPDSVIRVNGHDFKVREIWPDLESSRARFEALMKSTDEAILRLLEMEMCK